MAKLAATRDVDVLVGRRVKLGRCAMHMSQRELAEHLEVSQQQLQKYERGTNRIGAGRLYQAAAVLRQPLSYFFQDADTEHPARTAGAAKRADLMRPDNLELAGAFLRLRDAKARRAVVKLIARLAEED